MGVAQAPVSELATQIPSSDAREWKFTAARTHAISANRYPDLLE